MATKRLQQPQRSSKEAFLVICEGETERNYVDFLRNSYHSPIRIVSRVAGQQVTQQLINKHVEQLKLGKYDKITSFLMYDMDVEEVNRRFNQCKATLLLSNPCVELWFFLHAADNKEPMSSEAVIVALKNADPIWKQYKKGTLTFPQQSFLWQNKGQALIRAKALQPLANPSSSVYILLEKLEESLQRTSLITH